MPGDRPEQNIGEMKTVVDTFLRAGYSRFTDGYEDSFADYVDGVMRRNPEMAGVYRKGSQQLMDASSSTLEEMGVTTEELKEKYDMIKHVAERARFG